MAPTTFRSNTFTNWSLKHLTIDMEGDNLIVHVPDQRDAKWHTVQVDESQLVPTPTSCSCGHDDCFHRNIVTAFYNRIYKSNIEKAAAKVATPEVVEEVAPAAEQFDGSRPLTAAEWKVIQKADRKRQQAWQDEYREAVKEAAEIDRRGYKSALAS